MEYTVECKTPKCKMEPVVVTDWEEANAARAEHLKKKPEHDVRIGRGE